MNTQSTLLEPLDPKLAGYISPACRFIDEEGQRSVWINGLPVYLYDITDRIAERQIWVQVYENNYASQRQIATGIGRGVRTLRDWVARFRKEGPAGLIDKPRSGAPRKVTPGLRAKMIRLRAQRATLREIARATQLSFFSVQQVLAQEEEKIRKQQGHLPLSSEQQTPIASAQDHHGDPSNRLQEGKDLTLEGTEEHVTKAPPPKKVAAAVEVLDPLNRQEERALASVGMLEDAAPVFVASQKVEWAGAMMAAVLLSGDPLLEVARKIYGTLGAAFYGLRTVMMSLMFMALLRIKRPEDLRRHDPEKLGRVLGLDRAPEVKTLRRKLRQLCSAHRAAEFMKQMAQARLEANGGDAHVVMVDGHIQAYSGALKIGHVYCNGKKKVVKGRTESWVHLKGQHPVFSVVNEFNEGLVQSLPGVLEKAREVTGLERLTCVFDRGGYCAELFEKLLKEHDLVTYRKGNYEDIPLEKFTREPTLIHGKEYEWAPYECEEALELPIYETQKVAGKDRRKKTKRKVVLREIRLLRKDGGQTSILTSRKDWSATEVVETILSRWGSQENVFKYMLSEFDLDALWSYGSEEITEDLDHPNPAYTQLKGKRNKLQAQRNNLLAKYGLEVEQEATKEALKKLDKLREGKAGKKLKQIHQKLEEVKRQIQEVPARESVKGAGYKQLKSEIKILVNTLKISAYQIETQLKDMLGPYYSRSEQEGRRVIAAALKSSGKIALGSDCITIELERQSSPCRTRSINQLCERLNEMKAPYPGTNLTIVFKPTPLEA